MCQLVPTQGSIENLAMLHDPHSGVSVALIQGGSIGAGQKSGLESLGTLFYELCGGFVSAIFKVWEQKACWAERSPSDPKAVAHEP